MSKNDDKILQLKKEVENRKAKIGKKLRFSPCTTCIINYYGRQYNLNVLQKQELIMLKIMLNTNLMSAKELELQDYCVFDGFNVQDWIDDIDSKLEVLKQREEERELNKIEKQLESLLSEDKKVELELDNIESLLKK